ncbi:unnamed protein product [Prorocentrum cordatum]|uniref:Uncharacterized protein n=1 Tax=Prorocentrum cordatum TaxID=2364126 RepID=A0ABN9VIF3_9DINO|nr:unnamed protein product [Polarella glacialis]
MAAAAVSAAVAGGRRHPPAMLAAGLTLAKPPSGGGIHHGRGSARCAGAAARCAGGAAPAPLLRPRRRSLFRGVVQNLQPTSLQAIPEEESGRSSCASSLRSAVTLSSSIGGSKGKKEQKARTRLDDGRPPTPTERDSPGRAAQPRPDDARLAPRIGDLNKILDARGDQHT